MSETDLEKKTVVFSGLKKHVFLEKRHEHIADLRERETLTSSDRSDLIVSLRIIIMDISELSTLVGKYNLFQRLVFFAGFFIVTHNISLRKLS